MIAPPAASRTADDEALALPPGVRISGLTKSFDGQPLLDGFELTVKRG